MLASQFFGQFWPLVQYNPEKESICPNALSFRVIATKNLVFTDFSSEFGALFVTTAIFINIDLDLSKKILISYKYSSW